METRSLFGKTVAFVVGLGVLLAFTMNVSSLRYDVAANGVRFPDISTESIEHTSANDCRNACLNSLFCKGWNFKVAAGAQTNTCWLFNELSEEPEPAPQNVGGRIRWRFQ